MRPARCFSIIQLSNSRNIPDGHEDCNAAVPHTFVANKTKKWYNKIHKFRLTEVKNETLHSSNRYSRIITIRTWRTLK